MITNGLFKKTIATFCCFALLISGLTMSSASAKTIVSTNEDETYLDDLGINKGSVFYDLLIAFEELPEGIEEEGGIEIAQWLSNKTGLAITAEGEYLNFDFLSEVELTDLDQLSGSNSEDTTYSTYAFTVPGAFACIGALGTLLPITKILKIKKVLKAAGGAIDVMRQVSTQYKYYHKTKKYSKTKAMKKAVDYFSVKKKLSAGSKNLLKDFFSISLIAGSCGPLFTYEGNLENGNYIFNEDELKVFT